MYQISYPALILLIDGLPNPEGPDRHGARNAMPLDEFITQTKV